MSFPVATPQIPVLNPIENMINSFNSNPYFIGFMMLLLNLGGRHFATSLTPEQDKFFQSPWFRRGLIFVIFFVGTRNIIVSFIMTIVFIILLAFIFNDESQLFLFKPTFDKPNKPEKKKEDPAPVGLTAEETEIHRKLTEKIMKQAQNQKPAEDKTLEAADISSEITLSYESLMSRF
jgi:hypothetical protein